VELTTPKVRASIPAHEKALPVQPSSRKYVWLALNYLLMSLLSIFFLFPIVFMLISSLKADENQLLQDVSTVWAFIPYGDLSLQNYNDAFQRFPFGLYLFNSLFIVTCIVILGLLVNSLIAYALARMPLPGRKIILIIIVALVAIPFESVVVPLLLLVNQLPWFNGATTWVNSYQVQIIPFIADAFSIFLFYQFFIDIPKDIEEAAFVDGASRWRIYWQIVVPLSRPIFATVCALLIVLAGAVCIPGLPISLYPQLAPPQVIVTSNYIGANATSVESAVTTILEQHEQVEDQIGRFPHEFFTRSVFSRDDDFGRFLAYFFADPIHTTLPAHVAFAVLAHLQLALSHPGTKGPGSQLARKAAEDLQHAIAARCPSLRQVMEDGWNREKDVPIRNPQETHE